MTYYTYNAQTKQLAAVPRTMVVDGRTIVNPSAARYAAMGAYPKKVGLVLETPPGKIAVQDGYELLVGAWVPRYRYEDAPPPPPRRFVTADVIEQLMAEGVWPQIRAWLDQQGMTDMVLATKEFSENDPNFAAARDAAMQLLNWDAEKVAKVLAKAQGGAA